MPPPVERQVSATKSAPPSPAAAPAVPACETHRRIIDPAPLLPPPPPPPQPRPTPPETSPAPLPRRRADLIIVPHSAAGEYVIKDPLNGQYFHLGPQESALLLALDGQKQAEQILCDFEAQFAEPMERQDLDDFTELAHSMNLLVRDPLAGQTAGDAASLPAAAKRDQSILFWRVRLLDPNRLFNFLEPRIRFFWTPAFLVISAAAIVAAFFISWANREELISRFGDVLSWKTLFIAWFAVVVATTCHEFAHGLTCKHFGGEVRDIGFLLLFFMPAFYANVSDAWLFREKSKRLWVTLAGGYCDLCLWAMAVFVWRVTMQDSLTNYLAWVLMTICGVRSFFNFLPLIKLDGYYLLSDLTSTPNLRQRGWETFWGHVRWVLWGAPRPSPEPKRAYLLLFGAGVWLYGLFFLSVLAVWFTWWLGSAWGPLGTLTACALAGSVLYKQFDGLAKGEVSQMWRDRKVRVAALALGVIALAALMVLVPLEDKATGTFHVRSTARFELRAPVAGFLLEVHGDEGQRVAAGALVARMHIPDLDSRTTQKRAEIAENEAKLRVLSFGRPGASSDMSWESEIRRAEIDAAKANLEKLHDELKYLEERAGKLRVHTTIAGVISTARLQEKTGQFFNDGDSICVIEEPASLEAQIDVPEQEAARVRPGQPVQFKARSLPFDQLHATVDRIAPSANAPDPKEGKLQSTVPVYCKLNDPPESLRPGMTGFARISCGQRPMGRVLADKALRYLRTEFWW